MKNNYWEEMDMSKRLIMFHSDLIDHFNLPEWINEIKCPFCKRDLGASNIRFIGLKLNTRNLGDLAVEFFCPDCQLMDTLYFRQEADTIKAFSEIITNDRKLTSEPVVEEKMYKLNYNNTAEKMFKISKTGESDDAI